LSTVVNSLPASRPVAGETTNSLPDACDSASLPSTVTLVTDSASDRSRLKLDRSCVADAVMVAVPLSSPVFGS
jgi:hypothetical protein